MGRGGERFRFGTGKCKRGIGENTDHITVVVTKTTTKKCKFDTELTFHTTQSGTISGINAAARSQARANEFKGPVYWENSLSL